MMTDKELYVAFLEGDKKAFEAIVLRHRHQLVYFIMQYNHSYEFAEDIVQDVFAFLYVKPESYDNSYSLKTFLYTVAKRRAIDLMRKQTRESVDYVDEETLNQKPDVKTLESIVFEKEDLKRVKNALEKIKAEYKQVIILTQIDGLSMEETAKVLDKSVSSTKVLLHRARKSLKQKLESEL